MTSPLAQEYIENLEILCDVMEEFLDTWASTMGEMHMVCDDQQLEDIIDLEERMLGMFQEFFGEQEEGEQDDV